MNKFKIFAPMLKASMGPDGKMRLHGIASSTVKDRHGDTMNPSALEDMERAANNNLTIFLNHEYRVPEDVAGHVERALIRSHPQDPNIHDLTLDIVINEVNQRAKDAWAAIDAGTQLGLSIGAMVPDGGATRDRKSGTYSIDHVDLLETSLVGVPANPRSWVEYAVKSLSGGVEMVEAIDDESVYVRDADGKAVLVGEPAETVIEVAKEIDAKDLEHTDDPAEDLPAEEEPETDPETVMVRDGGPVEPGPVDLIVGESGPENIALTEDPRSALLALTSLDQGVAADVTNATVNIKTPYADVTIDTGNRGGQKPSADDGTSQEALASVPENEDEDSKPAPSPWAAIGLSTEPEMEKALVEPTFTRASELLATVTRELIETKAARDEAIRQRDAVMAMTEKVVGNMTEILARLSATPVGRRTVVREASDQFEALKSVYGEEFITLLKKG